MSRFAESRVAEHAWADLARASWAWLFAWFKSPRLVAFPELTRESEHGLEIAVFVRGSGVAQLSNVAVLDECERGHSVALVLDNSLRWLRLVDREPPIVAIWNFRGRNCCQIGVVWITPELPRHIVPHVATELLDPGPELASQVARHVAIFTDILQRIPVPQRQPQPTMRARMPQIEVEVLRLRPRAFGVIFRVAAMSKEVQ